MKFVRKASRKLNALARIAPYMGISHSYECAITDPYSRK